MFHDLSFIIRHAYGLMPPLFVQKTTPRHVLLHALKRWRIEAQTRCRENDPFQLSPEEN